MKSELPSTFKAFRFQQHRWSCGPANLFRKMLMEIIRSKVNVVCYASIAKLKIILTQNLKTRLFFLSLFVIILQNVKFWKKVYVIYSFFFVRKVIAHWVTFFFYCVVIPTTILIPEVKVPIWGAVYIPSVITILNSVGTPRYSLPSLVQFLYILLEAADLILVFKILLENLTLFRFLMNYV